MTPDSLIERGSTLLDIGRAREAEQHFREALAQDPSRAGLHTLLARALLQQDRDAEARDSARTATALDPHDLGALYVLAAAHAALEEWDEALGVVNGALRLAPDVAVLHRQAAAVLTGRGNRAEAVVAAERAVGLDPEDGLSRAVLAHAYALGGRRAEARAALDDAARLEPDHPEVHRIRSTVLLLTGDSRSTLEASRTSLRMDPTDADRRHAVAIARKARNPLYLALVRYSVWLSGLPQGLRILVIVAPVLLNNVIPGAALLIIPVLLLTWALEPLMNATLMLTREGRGLLPRDNRRATWGFLGYVAVAATSGVMVLVTPEARWGLLAVAAGLWALAAGSSHTVGRRMLGVTRVLHGLGALLIVAASAAFVLGSPVTASALAAGALVLGVVTMWVTALS